MWLLLEIAIVALATCDLAKIVLAIVAFASVALATLVVAMLHLADVALTHLAGRFSTLIFS